MTELIIRLPGRHGRTFRLTGIRATAAACALPLGASVILLMIAAYVR